VGTTQTRTHNAANEIGSISNWANPNEDNAGNMTSVPDPKNLSSSLSLTYDAWNRLVKAGTATYRYDGLHRRIEKIVPGTTTQQYYYNKDWQCVEVRAGTNEAAPTKEAYVWHPHYIDALAVRYWDSGDGDFNDANELQFALQDANYNVTGLTNSAGSPIERYHYSAYGDLGIFNGTWTSLQSSAFDNPCTFTGRRFDIETGLYQYRKRYYHAELGRFVNRDPKLFIDGPNLYNYTKNRPTFTVDPSGTVAITIVLRDCTKTGIGKKINDKSIARLWRIFMNCMIRCNPKDRQYLRIHYDLTPTAAECQAGGKIPNVIPDAYSYTVKDTHAGNGDAMAGERGVNFHEKCLTRNPKIGGDRTGTILAHEIALGPHPGHNGDPAGFVDSLTGDGQVLSDHGCDRLFSRFGIKKPPCTTGTTPNTKLPARPAPTIFTKPPNSPKVWPGEGSVSIW